MFGWVLDHLDIPTRTIFNSQKVAIGYFRPEHLQVMYKLSLVSNFVYNANFLVDFNKKECDQYGKNLPDLIKDWYSCPKKFIFDSRGIYPFVTLEPHIMYIEMMMCRLYGKENTTHFFLPWVPIIHTVEEGYSFDWEKILSDIFFQEIARYQLLRAKGQLTQFFMSADIMDFVCFMTPFPLMDWIWTPNSVEPIHIYHLKLWEEKEKDFFYDICNWVVVSMHTTIYGCPPPKISDKIVTNLGRIENWYIKEKFSYIRVFGYLVPPYSLP
jgi:hypothetical protein